MVETLFALPLGDLYLLVVDDNSPDGTGQLAEELGRAHDGRVQVLHRPGKMGLGSAYIQGFKMALERGAEAVGQMDADFSHDPLDIARFIASRTAVLPTPFSPTKA